MTGTASTMTTTEHDPYATTAWRDWSCDVRVVVDSNDRERSQAAAAAVRLHMDAVSAAVNRFDPDSEISQLNRTPDRLFALSKLAIELLSCAADVAKFTDGAVVPTLGRQLRDAGYVCDIDTIKERLSPASSPSYSANSGHVELDRRLGCARLSRGTELDLGATAKAWTVDTAVAAAAAAAQCAVVVSIGGDLACSLEHDWPVGVAETEGTEPTQVVTLSHGALATSSVMARRWRVVSADDHDPHWANHIIDPGTGRPVDGPWRTCSVWAPTAVRANALSTAALVWGESAVDQLTERGAAALLIGKDGNATTVGDWPERQEAA
jgi:FAD:protein FMN transferase